MKADDRLDASERGRRWDLVAEPAERRYELARGQLAVATQAPLQPRAPDRPPPPLGDRGTPSSSGPRQPPARPEHSPGQPADVPGHRRTARRPARRDRRTPRVENRWRAAALTRRRSARRCASARRRGRPPLRTEPATATAHGGMRNSVAAGNPAGIVMALTQTTQAAPERPPTVGPPASGESSASWTCACANPLSSASIDAGRRSRAARAASSAAPGRARRPARGWRIPDRAGSRTGPHAG
jgi:hypothetical protein